MEEYLNTEEKEIVESIISALKGKNFGLITIDLKINELGYEHPSKIDNSKVTHVSLIGHPSEIIISSVNIKN